MNIENAPKWLPSLLVPFFTLSYPTQPPAAPDSFLTSNYYATGLLDGCFVVTCIAAMAILRDAVRLGVMEPYASWSLTRQLARKYEKKLVNDSLSNGVANGNGHASHSDKQVDTSRTRRKEDRLLRRSVLRFAEQGWSMIYYAVQWAFGLYIHLNLPTSPYKPTQLWINYPHTPLSAPLKFYYLTQTSFYLHQILILNAEARRKDHIQMMTHHVITIALMITSYFCGFTRVGCLIIVLMDWCDIFLPLAKMFRYVNCVTLCDITFTWFLLSWFVTRHVLFILVIKSVAFDLPRLIPQTTWLNAGAICLILLIFLQIIQIIWFGMICRVAWRVVSGQGAEDTRSDDEENPSETISDTLTPPTSSHSDLKKRR